MKRFFLFLTILAQLGLLVNGQNTPNNIPQGNNNSLPANTNNNPRPANQPASNAGTEGTSSVFKNMRTYTQDAVLQIPKGTKLVQVEIWGGGGGGTTTGGGGGGAFVRSVFTIVDGGELTIKVGQGGRGGTTSGQAGGISYAQFKGLLPVGTSVTLSAGGGTGAEFTRGGNGSAIEGFGGQMGASSNYTIGYELFAGQDGEFYNDSFDQSGPNAFFVTRSIGKGGSAGNTSYTGGRGDVLINPNSPTPTYRRSGGPGKLPGGGGGGGAETGYNGASGMVIIYY